jgi:GTPase SAR1 family protein
MLCFCFAETFEHISRWLREIRNYSDDNIVVMIVGNKYDLRHLRSVHTEDVEDFCKNEGLFFIETSALDCTNVEKAFQQLLREVYHRISKSIMSAEDDIRGVKVSGWVGGWVSAMFFYKRGAICSQERVWSSAAG